MDDGCASDSRVLSRNSIALDRERTNKPHTQYIIIIIIILECSCLTTNKLIDQFSKQCTKRLTNNNKMKIKDVFFGRAMCVSSVDRV